MDRNYDVITLISKYLYFKKAIFAYIMKIVTIFIKTIFKDSKKVKRIRNYVSKCSLYLYFLIQRNLLISGEKMLMSAELKWCVAWIIYFFDLLWVRYNYAKFYHCRICVRDFRGEGPHIRVQSRKAPSWKGLMLSW